MPSTFGRWRRTQFRFQSLINRKSQAPCLGLSTPTPPKTNNVIFKLELALLQFSNALLPMNFRLCDFLATSERGLTLSDAPENEQHDQDREPDHAGAVAVVWV